MYENMCQKDHNFPAMRRVFWQKAQPGKTPPHRTSQASLPRLGAFSWMGIPCRFAFCKAAQFAQQQRSITRE